MQLQATKIGWEDCHFTPWRYVIIYIMKTLKRPISKLDIVAEDIFVRLVLSNVSRFRRKYWNGIGYKGSNISNNLLQNIRNMYKVDVVVSKRNLDFIRFTITNFRNRRWQRNQTPLYMKWVNNLHKYIFRSSDGKYPRLRKSETTWWCPAWVQLIK